MYVDSLNEPNDTGQRDSEVDDTEGEVTGEWSKEDLSMEGTPGTEQTMWVDPSFKGVQTFVLKYSTSCLILTNGGFINIRGRQAPGT